MQAIRRSSIHGHVFPAARDSEPLLCSLRSQKSAAVGRSQLPHQRGEARPQFVFERVAPVPESPAAGHHADGGEQ
jgi:hypothetical protein